MSHVVSNNDERLKYLIYKINNNTATSPERKEYMELLYKNNYISKADFEKYNNDLTNKKVEDTIIGLGLAALIGALLSELFNKK